MELRAWVSFSLELSSNFLIKQVAQVFSYWNPRHLSWMGDPVCRSQKAWQAGWEVGCELSLCRARTCQVNQGFQEFWAPACYE